MLKKSIYIIVVPLFFLISCKKDPSLFKIKNLNSNRISVFGHGGMGIDCIEPMNSFESLSQCLTLGSDGTELDVSVTKDCVLVLFHNLKLEETTNNNGFIKNKRWDEIKNCKYNQPIFSKANLIDASYFFDSVKEKKTKLFTFDCKVRLEDNVDYLNLFAETLIRHIDKYNLIDRCFVESYNLLFLKILQQKNTNIRISLYTSEYNTAIEESKKNKLFGLTIDINKISSNEIKLAHQNNLFVTLFNVKNEEDNIKAIEMNPDFIQTDKVDFLVNALKE